MQLNPTSPYNSLMAWQYGGNLQDSYQVGTPAAAPVAPPAVPTTQASGYTAPTAPTTPAADAANPGWFKSTFMKEGGGLNFDAIGSLADTIGSFGKLYMGYKANKLAEESLAFQKQSYETNLANQISSYNMALEDRINARTAQKNGTQAEADAYINKHKL